MVCHSRNHCNFWRGKQASGIAFWVQAYLLDQHWQKQSERKGWECLCERFFAHDKTECEVSRGKVWCGVGGGVREATLFSIG